MPKCSWGLPLRHRGIYLSGVTYVCHRPSVGTTAKREGEAFPATPSGSHYPVGPLNELGRGADVVTDALSTAWAQILSLTCR